MSARHVLTILAVADLARSKRFYDAVFAWPRTVDVPVYAEHELPGGMRLGLYERMAFAHNTGQVPEPIPPGGLAPTELYFHAEDPEALAQKLAAAGARELSAFAPRPWGDEAAYFADPDGNVLVVARPMPA